MVNYSDSNAKLFMVANIRRGISYHSPCLAFLDSLYYLRGFLLPNDINNVVLGLSYYLEMRASSRGLSLLLLTWQLIAVQPLPRLLHAVSELFQDDRGW